MTKTKRSTAEQQFMQALAHMVPNFPIAIVPKLKSAFGTVSAVLDAVGYEIVGVGSNFEGIANRPVVQLQVKLQPRAPRQGTYTRRARA